MKIIVDAMGGDNAPAEIVKGAVMAAEELGVDIILTGRGEEILKCLYDIGKKELPKGIEIANASETVEMDDDPATACRNKKDSSMAVSLMMLRDGKGSAVVSAGSTGALLAGSTLIIKRIKGIRRAALAPVLPNRGGSGVMVIDCGANADCTPEYLLQFAFMGSYYMEKVKKIASPRVALLNIGTERTKGTELQLETYAILEKAALDGHINFVGNVEARDVMGNGCDVVVCDGYSGNVLLKAIEGTGLFLFSEFKDAFRRSLRAKLGACLLKKDIIGIKRKLDADSVGGTELLGISKPVIKAHGSSNANAVRSAIRQAVTTVNAGVVDIIESNIDNMKIAETEKRE